MKKQSLILIALFLLAGPARPDDPAWTTLFEGQTLNGWVARIMPARPDTRSAAEKAAKPPPAHLRPADQRGTTRFFVEKGCIVGRAERYATGGFLCTAKDYGDFELEFEVFLGWPETKTGTCNSGIQIRTTWEPEPSLTPLNGLQVDIDTRPGFAGALFVESAKFNKAGAEKVPHPKDNPNPHTYFKANEWNRMRIRAVGPKIQTWVNDQPVTDADLPKLSALQPRGFIGLQVHEILSDKTAEVRWRNLRLRELPAQP